MVEELIELMARYREIDPKEIDPDKSFRDLGLDSLDVAELVSVIDEEYGVTMELSAEYNTLRKVAEYVEAARK